LIINKGINDIGINGYIKLSEGNWKNVNVLKISNFDRPADYIK
jgi:hypothetical protein